MPSYLPIPYSSGDATETHSWDNGRTVNGVYTEEWTSQTFTLEAPDVSSEPLNYVETEESEWKKPISDSESFSQIKRSGRIKMSNYSTGKTRLSRFIGAFYHNAYKVGQVYYGRCSSDDGDPQSTWWDMKGPFRSDLTVDWIQQGTYSYWSSVYPYAPFVVQEFEDVSSEIERQKTSTWNDVLNAYSLGEELGELGQTVNMLIEILDAVKHPIKSYRRAYDLLVKELKRRGIPLGSLKATKMLGDLWLQYRYGIMPLMYSARDIIKLLEKNPTFVTKRHKVSVPIQDLDRPDDPVYFYQTLEGTLEYKITVKGGWKLGSNSDRIDINPITTAWALTPLSFVVDWFVNIGDWLGAYVRTITSGADVLGCVAVKEKTTRRTYLHLEIDERFSYTWPGDTTSTCGDAVINKPEYTAERGSYRSEELFLEEETKETYDRKVFTSSDLELVLAPFLDWKRLLDGLALSLSRSTNALRRL